VQISGEKMPYTRGMTHSIELPDDVFALVEQMRRELGVSRAEVIRKAVAAQAKTAKSRPQGSKPKVARAHPLDVKLRKPAVDEPINAPMRQQLREARAALKRGEGVSPQEARRLLGL
jgi:Ribbon-helix-helix protein, copG family